MTIANFERRGNMFRASICGHANFNHNGPDIVCSACSILAYTLVESLLAIEEGGGFHALSSDMDEKAGSYYVELTARQRILREVEIIFETISIGFALLEKNFPENVKIHLRSGEK